jgi:hypothetical protein
VCDGVTPLPSHPCGVSQRVGQDGAFGRSADRSPRSILAASDRTFLDSVQNNNTETSHGLTLAVVDTRIISLSMRKRHLPSPFAFPMMMARLTAASLETILHRTTMMAKGTCSPTEYQRMIAEKATAARRSMLALMTGKNPTAVLAPYSSRARANARRLRRKG